MPQTPNNAPTYNHHTTHTVPCGRPTTLKIIRLFKVCLHPIKKIAGSTTRVYSTNTPTTVGTKIKLLRKEVIQPHLPVRLPCYDLAPITSFALGRSLRSRTSGTPGFHGLTGGVYKARERIHRAMADARLLANPASWGRVADPSPNWDRLSRLDAIYITPSLCTGHCNTCVAPDVRAVLI